MLKLLKLFKVNQKTAVVSVFIIMTAVFLLPNFAFALDVGTEAIGNEIALSNQDPRVLVARIINVFLGFLGVIAIILVIYAGWLWMTSGGDPAKIDKAKSVLKSAVIGLVIILSSWGITLFLLNRLDEVLFGGPTGPGGPGGFIPALQDTIIASHYPARNQTGVPRNTYIAITFKEPIDPASIIDDTNSSGTYGDWSDTNGNTQMDPGEYDGPNTANVHIHKDGDSCPPMGGCVITYFVSFSPDQKTFVFRPDQVSGYIGSVAGPLWYWVDLLPGILKSDGNPAFPGAIGIGYNWKFQTSTIIDLTPPQINVINPLPLGTYAPNVVVQVHFNEAVDPTSASGDTTAGFNNIEVQNPPAGPFVGGVYYIANQYRTVEFIPTTSCGTNSCGDTVYCLPFSANLRALVKSAATPVPSDGIVDMAGNALDGNADGNIDGTTVPDCDLSTNFPVTPYCTDPDGDDAYWDFTTTNTPDLTAPDIIAIDPASGAAGISLSYIPNATFNEPLLASSLIPGSTVIMTTTTATPPSYWVIADYITAAPSTIVYINHSGFADSEDYRPQFTSGILDSYQNCYSPAQGPGCGVMAPGDYCCDGAIQAVPCP